MFFDYSSLQPWFDALDAEDQLPYIPIHHADPHDRHDDKAGEHLWE